MSSGELGEIQKRFVSAVFGDAEPRDAAERLYRKMTRHSIREAAEKVYPATKQALELAGGDWDARVDELIERHPPRDFRLNWAVRELPSILPSGWLRELADHEWVRFEAVSARDAREGEWLNPTLILRAYRYPIAEWYRVRGAAPKALKGGKRSYVAVYRHPESEEARTLEVHEAAHALLAEWLAGGTPAASAESIAGALKQPVAETLQRIEPLLATLADQRIVLLNPARAGLRGRPA